MTAAEFNVKYPSGTTMVYCALDRSHALAVTAGEAFYSMWGDLIVNIVGGDPAVCDRLYLLDDLLKLKHEEQS